MQKNNSEIEPYIDRSYYDSTLRELQRQHPLDFYVGKRNPYNGRVIVSVEEAKAYLQQQAMSIMYRQAADMALSNIRSASSAEISALQLQVKDLDRKRSRSKAIAIILVLAVLVGATLLPERFREEYNSGYSEGYAAGQVYSASRSSSSGGSSSSRPSSGSSYSGSTSSGSSSSNSGETLLEQYRRQQAESQSSIYKTTPIAGYSLDMTVYVSISGGKIHRRSNCSGMKNYNTMTYGEACEKGYVHCKKCF